MLNKTKIKKKKMKKKMKKRAEKIIYDENVLNKAGN